MNHNRVDLRRRRPARTLGLALGGALSLCLVAACASSGKVASPARPATVVSVAGSPSVRVRLTADAVRRIDLQTATMKQQVVAGRPQLAGLGSTTTVPTATTGPPATTPTPAAPAPVTTTTAVARAPADTEPPKNGVTVPAAPAAPATATTPPPATAPPPAPTTTAPIPRLTVPAAAVLYRPSGDAFVYVVAGTLEYERQAVVVDYVIGDLAVLSGGPVAGTSVVTVGAAELLGAELGVGGAELG